jgi:hypothetical protein
LAIFCQFVESPKLAAQVLEYMDAGVQLENSRLSIRHDIASQVEMIYNGRQLHSCISQADLLAA